MEHYFLEGLFGRSEIIWDNTFREVGRENAQDGVYFIARVDSLFLSRQKYRLSQIKSQITE
jgi:hypothetical protein